MRAAGWDTDGVAFTLVDHPGLRPETLDKLVDAFESSGANLVLPLYYGERGHPAVISRAVLGQLLTLPAEEAPSRCCGRTTPRRASWMWTTRRW
ncbi:MAG: NTP transferase domain-containing protein [Bryobacterales bacterium]